MSLNWICIWSIYSAVISALGLAARSRDYAQRTERILDTVTGLFSSANPYSSNPEKATVGDVVRSTSQRFLSQDDPDPLFQVLMLERLAELQRAIRDYSVETALLQRADAVATRADLGQAVRSRLALARCKSPLSGVRS